MKKAFFLLVALTLSLVASAQTQQGYVKTKGRMVNGKLVPGQGLKGATVSIKGRTVVLVNTNDGAFSFPVPDKQFRLDSVRKKGYQLVDMEACPRTYNYSGNPIYIVMETPDQQLQDQLAAERKIRRNLQKQLQDKEDEIEDLKAQQKISDEEYRQALQKLYEDVDLNEQLVKDMVERYSKIDYDQLSEFDQKISELILNGELVKADSMLRTKGDINQRIEYYRKHEAINAKERDELTQRGAQLEQSEALAIQERDDLANDCYRKFEIFKMQHLNDSAAYYIELRAGLDTTNVTWALEASDFNNYIGNYESALKIYQNALEKTLSQTGDTNNICLKCYYGIGTVLSVQYNLKEARCYFEKALAIVKKVYPEDPSKVALLYNHIGITFERQGLYSDGLELHNSALRIFENTNDVINIAWTYYSIGLVLINQGYYSEALVHFNKALSKSNELSEQNTILNASIYNAIGGVCSNLKEYDKALEYYLSCCEIREKTFGTKHPDVANSYGNIGYVYNQLGDYEKAIAYQQKALDIRENVFGKEHEKIGISYLNIGAIFMEKGDYSSALEYHKKALAIFNKTFDKPNTIVATTLNNIGYLYNKLGDAEQSLDYYLASLEIRENTLGKNNPKVASIHSNIGILYYKMNNYNKALFHLHKALDIYLENYGEDSPKSIETQNSISEIQAKLKEQENQPNE